MRRFIEKLFIMTLCLYHSYISDPRTDIVFLFLSCLILSLLLDLLHTKEYKWGIYFFFILLCFIYPAYIFYLPLILYNAYLDFKAYALIFFSLLLAHFSLINLLIALIAGYLSATSKQYNDLVSQNKITRDSLTEDALYLRKYNDQLQVDREKNIHIAILTERNRIARELHDAIGHTISSAILQVEALKITSRESKTAGPLETLQHTLKTGMKDIRNSIHNLYSESLHLENKIYELSKDIPKLTVELDYRMGDELSYELKFDILSIIKEAMTNCTKHANANKLKISLLEQPKFYSIIIKDDGSYFDQAINITSKGIGLSSMEEIADKYNGFFNYGFEQGFKIHITLMKG